MEMRKRRRGKNIFDVPFYLYEKRRKYIRVKWFIESIKMFKSRISFSKKLTFELLKTLSKRLSLTQKKSFLNQQRLKKNHSNLHFRW